MIDGFGVHIARLFCLMDGSILQINPEILSKDAPL